MLFAQSLWLLHQGYQPSPMVGMTTQASISKCCHCQFSSVLTGSTSSAPNLAKRSCTRGATGQFRSLSHSNRSLTNGVTSVSAAFLRLAHASKSVFVDGTSFICYVV